MALSLAACGAEPAQESISIPSETIPAAASSVQAASAAASAEDIASTAEAIATATSTETSAEDSSRDLSESAETASSAETVSEEAVADSSNTTAADAFYAEEIPDDIFAAMQGLTYKADCPVPREDLRYVHVLHVNDEGETLEGELVCHKRIADDLVEIFRALYEGGYPIERIRLMDVYGADDETAMTDNNSSCFNYRTISHSNKISKHGLGVAVDINTLYNPYTKTADGKTIVEPEAGRPYLDRSAEFPYKITEGDLCWTLFTQHGFIWGGSFRSVKDYQHFELPDSVTDELETQYMNLKF